MSDNINWSKVLKGKIYGFSELKTEAKEGRIQRVYCRVERELKVKDILAYKVIDGEILFTTKDGKKYREVLEVLTNVKTPTNNELLNDMPSEPVDKKHKPSIKRSKYERRSC